MSEGKRIIKIAGVYTAIILGAGFASGQELAQFFVRHGAPGFAGLLISGVLFSFVGFATLDICLTKKLVNYNEFMETIMGRTCGRLVEPIVAAFLFVLFATMLAAGGATVREAFGLRPGIGTAALALLCFITFLFGVEGIVEVNSFLAPIMVVGGIFIGIFTALNKNVPAFLYMQKAARENWVLSGIVYASYNIITAISVLCAMHKHVNGRRVALWSGVLGGAAMTLLGICMSLPLVIFYADAAPFEIPLLYIVHRYGPAMEYFYLLILMMAIFTTAVADGFALIEWICATFKINRLLVQILVTAAGIVAARTGFSNFVANVYPMFGFFGLFEIIMITIYFFRSK